MKRKISIILIATLVTIMFAGVGAVQAYVEAKKIKLSTKKVTLYKGKTKTIKLKYANKKVKWKIKNKMIAKIVKKSGKKKNTVKIKGLKKGSTKLIATCGKKKFTTKIVIKEKKLNNANKVNEEEKIIGIVTNTKFTYYGKLYVKYKLLGDTDETYFFGMAPGKLEILENGVWKSLVKKPLVVPDVAAIVDKNSNGYLEVPLYDSYEGLREGHYRYTHTISGIEVPVEFDFDDGIDVVISNNKIAMNGDLTVRFSYKDKREFRYIKGIGKLEIYEDGQWTEMKKIVKDVISDLTGGTLTVEATDSFTLNETFENIRVGHYRYTVQITDMPIEFDIVE